MEAGWARDIRGPHFGCKETEQSLEALHCVGLAIPEESEAEDD